MVDIQDYPYNLDYQNLIVETIPARYVQKLRRRLNYTFKKASKYSDQQAQKYKSSYDKSMKGPQLQEKDVVLVKIVAHKGRHKLQDKWEPEEYVVVEQPIAGTPVYKVQPVNGGNIRTLHRNLLLPIRVKLEPDYKSDDSILDEDSDDDSIELVDSKTKVYGKGKSPEIPSELEIEEKEPKSKLEYSDSDLHFEPDTVILPDSKIVESLIALEESVEKTSGKESIEFVEEDSHPNVEDSSDKVIPEDVSLPSKFLLPNIDDSCGDEETEITELKTKAEINVTNIEEEMPSINSEASSLVNTNEFLEFIDTIETDKAENAKQSESAEISEQTGISEVENPTEQTNVDHKSESQFSSFMSYHEGESSSMDPSTGEMELSKSPKEESTE